MEIKQAFYFDAVFSAFGNSTIPPLKNGDKGGFFPIFKSLLPPFSKGGIYRFPLMH